MTTKAEKWAKLHDACMQSFNRVQQAMRNERMQCLEDRRFYSIAGAQWEGPLYQQYQNRVRLEVNKVNLAVMRVINEYRNNKITVNFVPKDGKGNDQLADTCAGLFRADEQNCVAQEAYNNAFEEAVGGGFGAIRLRNAYEDENEAEEQTIYIDPIYDADSCVFFDLDARRQDKADAKECWVLTAMSMWAYEEEFGKSPSPIQKTVTGSYFDWWRPEFVYIAEYYRKEAKTILVRKFRGLTDDVVEVIEDELEDEELAEKLDILQATGYVEEESEKRKIHKVRKYIVDGNEVLEDCGYIPGNVIPIIPVYAKRWIVDGVERCAGIVRYAKDAQRIENMLRTLTAELAVNFKTEKPVFTPEQMANPIIAQMWAEDNVKNFPYLLASPVTNMDGTIAQTGPVAYTKAPNLPPAVAALIQTTEQDLSDLLGNQERGEEMLANQSGKAVELVQNKIDMQSFIYLDNFAVAMKRLGEIWLAMKKEVTVEEGRTMKTVGPDGKVGQITVGKSKVNPDTGEVYQENDLTQAKLGVDVQVGPSSASKRAAAVRALSGMAAISADPQTKSVLELMSLMNMEAEGVQDVRTWARNRLLQLGAVKPTPEEEQELAAQAQNQQPSAQDQYLLSEVQKNAAEIDKLRADVIKTLTAAGLDQAKIEEIGVKLGLDIDRETREGVLAARDLMNPPQNLQS